MNKKIFNPQEWLQPAPNHSTAVPSRTPSDDIETITSRIETSAIDIAPTYAQWRDLGFALSDHLGEAGRSYYHRISRFHPDYTQENTDSQYDRCVRAHGSGITIKTFFQLAKEAGIQVSTRPDIIRLSKLSTSSPDKVDKPDNVIMPEKEEDLPTFSDKVHDHLPEYLKKIVAVADNDKDADILLLDSLTALSACLTKIIGIYDKRTIHPNLFTFITARASAGKGRLTLCRNLIDPIHEELRQLNEAEREEYKSKLNEYNAS